MPDKFEVSGIGEMRDRVSAIVARIARVNIDEVEDDVLIRDELGIDSLMALEILASCEREFNVRIPEERLAEVEEVGEFLQLLEEARKAQN